MTPAESSQVAQRNLEFYRNSFGASAEKSYCETDCMRSGSGSQVSRLRFVLIGLFFEVLRPNGQPKATSRSEILQGHLS